MGDPRMDVERVTRIIEQVLREQGWLAVGNAPKLIAQAVMAKLAEKGYSFAYQGVKVDQKLPK